MNHGRFRNLTRALAATAAGALMAATPAPAITLKPSADVHVSAAQPQRNFGTARRLVIARRPAQRAYVRFEVGSRPFSAARLVLRVYSLRRSQSGLLVRHASDQPWQERRITYRTAPHTGPRVVRSGPLARRRWTSIDVTNLVDASGVVALSLAAAGAHPVALASREVSAFAPRLVVEGTRSGTPAPTRPGTHVPTLPTVHPPPSPGLVPPARPVPVDPAHPCGVAAAAPAWEHVVWIVFENKAATQIMGVPDAPYLNSLAATCTSMAGFFGVARPSLPNYIAMTSGDTQGISDNDSPAAHPLDVPSIFSQLGNDWRALQESMTSSCDTTSGGLYAARHNPAAYYTNIAADCLVQDVPLADPPDISARFTFLTPNLCSGMHNCPVASGDMWLSQWIPKILDTPQYRSGTTAVFITWDEDNGGASQQIPTFVIAPSVPGGFVDATRYDHYSLLLTTQEMLGLPPLGLAATATSMRAALHL